MHTTSSVGGPILGRPRRETRKRTTSAWTMASIASNGYARWPQRVALADDHIQLTFAELYGCAQSFAERLTALGVRAGDRVAVAGERDVDSIVAIFGVVMLGACYVPLDPAQPLERLRFLLQDAQVSGLVAKDALRELGQTSAMPRFFVELGALSCVTNHPAHKQASEPGPVAPNSVAYLMYTSGSTGLPKGVQIEHASVQRFFETHNERADIRPGDRCLNTGPLHFDVSLMDIFLPLYAGASVFFGSKLPLPTLTLRAIERHAITHVYAVGTVLALITGDGRKLDQFDLSSLRLLQTGAEVCNVRIVNEWLRRYPRLGFLNSYGPTEATVGCISYLKPKPGPITEERCPIGVPHRDTTILLLSPNGQVMTGVGEVGELLIGGPQLMRSYFHRDVENDSAFTWLDGVRYYRTGDHAYRDEQGNYQFVGRRDDEIKLNGHRIHLNEVLRCVHEDLRVESAVAGVITLESGARELAVIAASAGPHSRDLALQLEQRVANALPAAMRPERWAFVSAFPRLSSGKVDRAACLERLSQAINASDARHYTQSEQSFNPM